MAGILGSVYRALDPILPFDRYLDSRFGILGDDPRQMPAGGVLGAMGGVQPPSLTPAAYAPPQPPQSAPELAGGPPQAQSINPRMGFPTMGAPRMGAASQAAPQAAPRRTSGWRVLDRVLGGSTITDALDTERMRPQLMEEAARKRAREVEEDAIARRVFADDERGYLAWRANREKAGEALSSGLEDYTLAPGGVRGRAGETLQRAPFAPINASPGTQVIDPTTGKVIAQAPFKPEVVTAPTTSSVTVVDPNAPGGGPSVGERNNNPGNLEDGEFARSQPGYVGTDGRFARFATPEAGAAAQETLLTNAYIGRGQNTIQSIIEGVPGEGGRRVHGYSPRQSDGGDNTDEQVNNYIGYVARRAGVDPSAPIPADRVRAVAAAMREFETGQRPGGQGGGARVVQQGTARPGWTVDPTGRFQISPEGKREALPGLTMAPKLQAAEDEDLAAIEAATGTNSLLGNYQTQIENGSLNLGPLENVGSTVSRFVGMARPNDIAVGSFRAGLERMRNDSLRLNKGIQTEGDSQRAWNELVTNINDENFVKQRLKEIQAINERAVEIRQAAIALRRQRSGLPPIEGVEAFMTPTEFPQQDGARAGGSGARQSPTAGAPRTTKPPVQVRTLREAEALPKGTVFILNGRRGVNR